MIAEIEKLQEETEKDGLSVLSYTLFKSMEQDKKRLPKERYEKIKEIASRMRREGVEGKEISKAVFKELKNAEQGAGYKIAKREDKADIRKILKESERLDEFLQDITEEVLEGMELNDIPYDISNIEAATELMSIDFRDFFNLEVPRNDFFPCRLVKGNQAWYSMDLKTGFYRYFTQNEAKEIYGFNFLDMVEIVEGYSFVPSLRHITKKLKLNYREGDWMQQQELKYLNNITVIEKAEREIKKDFPELYKYIKTYLPILSKIMNIGVANIYSQRYSVQNESVFYASHSYISKHDMEKDAPNRTKVTRAVNLFTTLGLLKKEKSEQVPGDMVEKARDLAGDFAKFNLVSFYTVPLLDYLTLKEANEKVEKLRGEKINNKQITRVSVAKVFGEDVAVEVYGEEKEEKRNEKDPARADKAQPDINDLPIEFYPF